MLCTPALFRRLGAIRGIVLLECGAAASMALLATGPSAALAAAGFVALNACYYMGEPAILTTLMDRVPAHQRSGASAMYIAVTSIAGALAALAAGAGIARFGYSAVLAVSAGAILASAALFRAFAR